MTEAQKKAKELVSLFFRYNTSWHYAKQCAIICVEEIIKSFDGFMDSRRNFRHELEIDAERYWKAVKSEIENL